MKKRVGFGLTLVLMLAISFLPIFGAHAAEILVWEGEVSSSGASVTTPPLVLGVTYRIVAYNVYWLGSAYADAQYYSPGSPDPMGWVWPSGQQVDSHSFLQIDGNDVNWGPFSNGLPGYPPYLGHQYEIEYVGEDAPITFSIHDWFDSINTDHQCHLDVSIYREEGTGPGLTPGFWKHNVGVYLTSISYPGVHVNGAYSDPTGATEVTKDTMGDWLSSHWTDAELYALFRQMSPQLDGTTADIRNTAANVFNVAAGLSPGPPWI